MIPVAMKVTNFKLWHSLKGEYMDNETAVIWEITQHKRLLWCTGFVSKMCNNWILIRPRITWVMAARRSTDNCADSISCMSSGTYSKTLSNESSPQWPDCLINNKIEGGIIDSPWSVKIWVASCDFFMTFATLSWTFRRNAVVKSGRRIHKHLWIFDDRRECDHGSPNSARQINPGICCSLPQLYGVETKRVISR